MLIVTNVISRINWPLKNITHQATWGLTCAITGSITAQYREGETTDLHRDILTFSFIPLMNREDAVHQNERDR